MSKFLGEFHRFEVTHSQRHVVDHLAVSGCALGFHDFIAEYGDAHCLLMSLTQPHCFTVGETTPEHMKVTFYNKTYIGLCKCSFTRNCFVFRFVHKCKSNVVLCQLYT